MWSTVNIRLSLSTPYQQQTPHETPNGIAIDQAPSYTETVAPEGLSQAHGLTGKEAASNVHDKKLLGFIPPGVHDVTTYHVFAPLPDWGAFMEHVMVKEQDQPRIGADFALFIPFIIEECCLASFKLTFASIEINLYRDKADLAAVKSLKTAIVVRSELLRNVIA